MTGGREQGVVVLCERQCLCVCERQPLELLHSTTAKGTQETKVGTVGKLAVHVILHIREQPTVQLAGDELAGNLHKQTPMQVGWRERRGTGRW